MKKQYSLQNQIFFYGIFALVAAAPILFVGGFVRVYQSNLWTLTYRALPRLTQSVSTAGTDLLAPDTGALTAG